MGVLVCHLCHLAGRPADERFRAPAHETGRVLMRQHVLEPHPAVAAVAVSFAEELVDVPLPGGDH